MPRLCRTATRAAVIAVTGAKNSHKSLNGKERNLRLAFQPHQHGVEFLQDLDDTSRSHTPVESPASMDIVRHYTQPGGDW